MYPNYKRVMTPAVGVRCSRVIATGLDARGYRIAPVQTCMAPATAVLVGYHQENPIVLIACEAHALEAVADIGVIGPVRDYVRRHAELPGPGADLTAYRQD